MTPLRVGSTNGGPSVSSLPYHRNHTQGNGASLFGKSIPSGRRTPSKRIPRCPVKPSIGLEALEESEEIEVSANSAGDHESSSKGGNVVVHKKSSKYRGVTKHRVTERYEAHLWDKTAYNSKQKKKGRQVYLGAYDEERAAAQAYDLAALKYWGPQTTINFKLENYSEQLKEMEKLSKEEYLATLRRKSTGFSRGASKYRGVARHHHNGRWEARISRVEGNKYLYLGTFNTEEEAAEAYDRKAIYYRKAAAVTNFELSRYPDLCHLYQDNSAKQDSKNKITIKNSPMANTTTEGENSSRAAEDPEDSAKQIIDEDMDSTIPDDDPFDEVVPVVENLPKLYTSGLHIDHMKDYKLEGFLSLPSQPDEFPGLGIDYDEMLAGFNVLDEPPFPLDGL